VDRSRQRRAFHGIIHHDDAAREWAYDGASHAGKASHVSLQVIVRQTSILNHVNPF
jgi:hypothetical protein